MNYDDSVDLNIFWIIIRRHYRMILLFIVLGIGIGAALAFLLPKTYTASARVNVNTIVSDPFNPTRAASGLLDVITEEATAGSWVVAKQAAENLDNGTDVTVLRQNTVVRADSNATTVTISYSTSSESVARAGADAVATAYLEFRQQQADDRKARISDQLNRRIDSLRKVNDSASDDTKPLVQDQIATIESQLNQLALIDTNGGSVLNPAAETNVASEPSKKLFIAAGAVFGLIAGCLLAFLVHRVDRKVRGAIDIQRAGFPSVFSETVAPVTRYSQLSTHQLDLYRTVREKVLDSPIIIRTLCIADLGRIGLATRVGPQIAAIFAQANERVELLVLSPNQEDFPWGMEPYDFQLEEETAEARFYRSSIMQQLTLIATKPVTQGLAPDPFVTNFVRQRVSNTDEAVFRILALPREAFESSHFSAARISDSVLILVPYKFTAKADVKRYHDLISDLQKPVLATLGLHVVPRAHARRAEVAVRPDIDAHPKVLSDSQGTRTP